MSVQHAGVSHELPQRHGGSISFFPYFCCSNGWCLFSPFIRWERIIESELECMRSRKRPHIYFVTDMRLSPRIATRTILLLYEITHFRSKSLNSFFGEYVDSSSSRHGLDSRGGFRYIVPCGFHRGWQMLISSTGNNFRGNTTNNICPWNIYYRHNVASSIICFIPIQM